MAAENPASTSVDFVDMKSDGSVVEVRLNRPPENMLNIEMMEEINSKLLDLRDRSDVKVLIIRGFPEAFSAGIDIGDHTRAKVNRMVQVFHRIFETIRLLDVVSVAAVQGKALDGGFELAMGCNLIVASRSARFALPEIERGTIPPVACIMLPAMGPRRKAMEWILTGAEISAEELCHYGMVNAVYEDDEFDEKLAEFVARITKHSAPVLQLAKRAQVESYYSSWGDALYRVENLYLKELVALNDWQEGIHAHMDGREPEWTDS